MAKSSAQPAAQPADEPSDSEFPPIDEAALKAAATEEAHRVEAFGTRLVPLAIEINVRIAKARQYAEKADDHKLAAVIMLKEAEAVCKESGRNFDSWATQNVKSYTAGYLEKLVRLSRKDDPAEVLRLQREQGAARGRRHYAKNRLQMTSLAGEPFTPVGSDGPHRAKKPAAAIAAPQASLGTVEQVITASKTLALQMRLKVVESLFDTLDNEAVTNLMDVTAQNIGMRLTPTQVDRETVEQEFRSLPANDRTAFVRWAVEQVGGILTLDAA